MSLLRIAALCLVLPTFAYGLDVRFHPSEVVYPAEEQPDRQIFSIVLHQIALINTDSSPDHVTQLTIEVIHGGAVTQTIVLREQELAGGAKRLHSMEQQGLLKLFDFHFQTSRVLGPDIVLSPSTTLAPNTALLAGPVFISVKGLPESVRATAQNAGKTIGQAEIKVENYTSPAQHNLPLSGSWYAAAAASVHTHHRWVINEEFALDLVQLGDGNKTYSGRGDRLEDYHCYGKQVLATADGTVVEIRDDLEDSTASLKKAEESIEQYEQRVLQGQNQLLATDPRAAAGNLVVIRHSDTEFSQYAHLKHGSITVKKGDVVKQGQMIASVGNTGNSTEPHLHFQFSNGADPLYSRALPARFQNIIVDLWRNRFIHSGEVVQTTP